MTELVKSSIVLKAIEKFVRDQYAIHHTKSRPFHTWKRARELFRNTNIILKQHALSKDEKFIIRSAAWFQTIGYIHAKKDFVNASAAVAENFLQAYQLPKSTITEIKRTILATRVPQQSKNVCQMIVCDAVLFHLGSSKFRKYGKLLRKEEELVKGQMIDKLLWLQQTIAFMAKHKYFTEYAQQSQDQQKADNLQYLLKRKSAEANKLLEVTL